MYVVSKYCTDPHAVKFACQHGIKENPLYLQCDKCGNVFCEVRAELEIKHGSDIFKHDSDLYSYMPEIMPEPQKQKLTPAEQWREIFIGMAVCAVICFIAWLTS